MAGVCTAARQSGKEVEIPAPSGGTATQEPLYTCNSVQGTGTLATDTVRCEVEIITLAQVSNGEIISPSRVLHYTDRAEQSPAPTFTHGLR